MSKLAWLGQVTQSHTLRPTEKGLAPLAPGRGSANKPFSQAGIRSFSPLSVGPRSGHLRGLSQPGLGGTKALLESRLRPPLLHPPLCCRGCQIWARSHPLDTPADPREPSPRI